MSFREDVTGGQVKKQGSEVLVLAPPGLSQKLCSALFKICEISLPSKNDGGKDKRGHEARNVRAASRKSDWHRPLARTENLILWGNTDGSVTGVLQLALPKIKFSSMSITWIRGSTLLRQSRQSVGACDVLIAVIGRRWLISFEAEGSRRLDNPDDFVRLEIATGAQA